MICFSADWICAHQSALLCYHAAKRRRRTLCARRERSRRTCTVNSSEVMLSEMVAVTAPLDSSFCTFSSSPCAALPNVAAGRISDGRRLKAAGGARFSLRRDSRVPPTGALAAAARTSGRGRSPSARSLPCPLPENPDLFHTIFFFLFSPADRFRTTGNLERVLEQAPGLQVRGHCGEVVKRC